MNTKPLSWTPRRRGDIYCAPACGGGCTHAAFLKAHADAKRLCKRLGPGWEADVYENLGWHYSVHKGQCHVYRNGPGRYWASLETKHGQFHHHARTPKKAVDAIVKQCVEVAEAMLAVTRP